MKVKSWKQMLRDSIKSLDSLFESYPEARCCFNAGEEEKLREITREFPLRITRYYAGLIDWRDFNDPLRNIVFPRLSEADLIDKMDVSGEAEYTHVRGLQHKFSNTALILTTSICAGHCRPCFRKRFVGQSNGEITRNVEDVASYIAQHPEIDNAVLSGGDSLMMDNKKMEGFLYSLLSIPSLRIIRIDTRMSAFLPQRFDGNLLKMLSGYNKDKRIYVVHSFFHQNELTEEANSALERISAAGLPQLNQFPLLSGINDSYREIRSLCNKLSYRGVEPYYIFQCKPVKGTKSMQVPLKRGCEIVEEAKREMSGVAKTFRYVLSNFWGKLEVIGKTPDNSNLILQYHQDLEPKDVGKTITIPCNAGSTWVD